MSIPPLPHAAAVSDGHAPPAPPGPSAPPLEARATATDGPVPVIRRGACHVIFAYDIGFSVDLERAQQLAAQGASRGGLARTRPAPSYFTFDPPPVRFTGAADPIGVAGYHTQPGVEYALFDFGGLSISYRVALAGPLASALDLSLALNENHELLVDSRARVDRLLRAIRPAVTKPRVTDFIEDYLVFEIAELDGPAPQQLLQQHADLLARILRGEPRELSRQETDDTLSCRISYSTEDLAVLDWNAALIIDRDPEDVRSVLEYANLELLEMRHLDDRLDRVMEEGYDTVARRADRWRLFPSSAAALHRIAELQADSIQLFESVNNALKLIGDQYLARVYRLSARRLHLPEWDASILRKIAALESLYDKLADRRSNRRMETLEWIIIGLIAFEIILSLWPAAWKL